MQKRWLSLVAIVGTLVAGNVCPAQNPSQKAWIGTWAASPMLAQPGFSVKPFSGTTLRQIVHVTIGGPQIRIRFTNAYGSDPLTIADAHVAMGAGGASIQTGSDHPVTFGGAVTVRIAPGAEVYSDPVPFAIAPLSNLAISFFVPNQVMRAETFHDFADQQSFVANGDVVGAPLFNDPTALESWYFIDGVEVPAVENSRAIIAFGDSITDGACSTMNANHRWPDVLASRLKQNHDLKNVSVLNQGIGGNRVLNEDYGPSALSRLDRDVLAQDGAKAVIVLEGINDIGRLARPKASEDDITAENLEYALGQIASAAHQHGIKVFGATLTPYGGAGYYSDQGEQVREAVNNWIRTSGTFDGVIDFDKITQDPSNTKQLNPLYDCGDHLHPNDAGYKAMGEGIDLSLLAR